MAEALGQVMEGFVVAAGFRDLVVWQKAMDWLDAVYDASEQWPQRELYRLTDQLRRAALSVPANIAEGKGDAGRRSFCTTSRSRVDRSAKPRPA